MAGKKPMSETEKMKKGVSGAYKEMEKSTPKKLGAEAVSKKKKK